MTKNNNVNKNSNIVYLDFSDYDIKKKTKKKKVKKKVNNKKKSVDKLKETLSQFDTLLNEAKENNIEIPKELGELPVNIEDVNSIKELNELNEEIMNRNLQIKGLLEQGITEKQEPEFGIIPITDSGGIQIQAPVQLPFQAGMQAQAPQIIPPQIIQQDAEKINMLEEQIEELTKSKDKPNVLPERKKDLSDIKKQLEKEQEEIINKLSPEEQEKVRKKQAEIEKEKASDFDKQDPKKDPRDLPSLKAGFQIITPENKMDQQILGKSFEEPIGLYDRWETIKGMVERLQNIGKEDPREPNLVNISRKDFDSFSKDQKERLKSYTIFVKNLNPMQTKAIQGELSSATRINKEILLILNNKPKKVLENIFSSKFGRNVKIKIIGSEVLPKPKPRVEKIKKIQETPKSLGAIKILEEMRDELETPNRVKKLSGYQKDQLRIILNKIKQSADLNKKTNPVLINNNVDDTFNNYFKKNKNGRLNMINQIIKEYKNAITGVEAISQDIDISKFKPEEEEPVAIDPEAFQPARVNLPISYSGNILGTM